MDNWHVNNAFMFEVFTDFLSTYHESKWTNNKWYDEEYEGTIKRLVGGKICLWPLTFHECSSLQLKKYIIYQWSQLRSGKGEIVYAFNCYLLLNKKTRTIGTQTEVSLSPNKKYFTNKNS